MANYGACERIYRILNKDVSDENEQAILNNTSDAELEAQIISTGQTTEQRKATMIKTAEEIHYAGALGFMDHIGWFKYIVGPIIMLVGLWLGFMGSHYWNFNTWILLLMAFWSGAY